MELVHDRALAEDAVQDTWLVVLERVDRFEGRSSLLTWLTGIALNRARDHRRRTSRAVPLFSLRETAEPQEVPRPAARQGGPQPVTELTAERMVLERERSRALNVAVDALPDTQRSVVLLQLRGFDPAETRETLKITDLARRVRLSRARSRLRNDLLPFAA
jgi:RNA polymerase sigma-70 factor (ECF subfamily)